MKPIPLYFLLVATVADESKAVRYAEQQTRPWHRTDDAKAVTPMMGDGKWRVAGYSFRP